MVIGVDVDGTLTNIFEYQLEKGISFFKDSREIDSTKLDVKDIFNCTDEEVSEFWIKYIWEYCLFEPFNKELVNCLNKLKKEGAEIHIITKRVHTLESGFTGNLFRKMLESSLKKNGLEYDSIVYCGNLDDDMNKVRACNDLKVDYMIEDDPDNIKDILNLTNSKVICVDRTYNKNLVECDRLIRAYKSSDVDSVIREDFIPSYKKFESDKYKFGYGVVRIVGAPLFKTLYKPVIINKQFIPKDGPIILCGNHLHVWDQFPVISSTSRTSHWMAKKEYFDSKLGPFFKSTGAISVDRFGDPRESVEIAMNYLELGSAIGIFPEGTRNHPKKEVVEGLYNEFFKNCEVDYDTFKYNFLSQSPRLSQINLLKKLYSEGKIDINQLTSALQSIDEYLICYKNNGVITEDEYYDSLLLPFKFGAVSMAKKTNATIVPFGVTGDYKIGSKNLIIRFGEPFKVKDDLEKSNTELRNKVLSLVKENLK